MARHGPPIFQTNSSASHSSPPSPTPPCTSSTARSLPPPPFASRGLNLTTAVKSSSSHLSSDHNLTVAFKNLGNHITFFMTPLTLRSSLTVDGDVQITIGTIPTFVSEKKNKTAFYAIAVAAKDLDTEATTSLRFDLRRRTEVPMRIEIDTKVKVKWRV